MDAKRKRLTIEELQALTADEVARRDEIVTVRGLRLADLITDAITAGQFKVRDAYIIEVKVFVGLRFPGWQAQHKAADILNERGFYGLRAANGMFGNGLFWQRYEVAVKEPSVSWRRGL